MRQVTIPHTVQGLYDDGFHSRSRLSQFGMWIFPEPRVPFTFPGAGAGKFWKLFRQVK